MNKIVKLDEERSKRTDKRKPAAATAETRPPKRPRWKPSRIRPSSIVSATIIALVVLGGYLVATQDITADLGPPMAAGAGDPILVRFGICPDGLHRDCVVDGDTFWLGDQKIRIADIDTRSSARRGARRKGSRARRRRYVCSTFSMAGHFRLWRVIGTRTDTAGNCAGLSATDGPLARSSFLKAWHGAGTARAIPGAADPSPL